MVAPSAVAPLLVLGSIDTPRSALMSLAPNPALRAQGLHNVQHLRALRTGLVSAHPCRAWLNGL